jgi:polyphosphate kinase
MSATPLTRPGTRETGDTSEAPLDLRRAWLGRDVSWLEFNQRVLHEALDDRTPLLERVKFLAIFSSNLDEFFMKRMALIRPMADDTSLAAQERRELLLRTREMITAMLEQQAECYVHVLRPRLAEHGVHLTDWEDLTAEQREELATIFDTDISPVLTPLSLDDAHPFPYVSNLSTSWAFRLEDPVTAESVLVRVKVPRELPQWLRVRTGVATPERVFVSLDQVIAANANKLFPGLAVARASLFRVCRDAEVEADEEDDGISKRALVEREVLQRRFEPVVRLEIQPGADPAMVA